MFSREGRWENFKKRPFGRILKVIKILKTLNKVIKYPNKKWLKISKIYSEKSYVTDLTIPKKKIIDKILKNV